MKIAVLGARGFLGSYLVEHLGRHNTVIPVTRETVDLTDYGAVDSWLRQHRPDVVVNCAISGGGQAVDDINYTDVQRDLSVFLNFYNNPVVKRYINIGSGAEFDRRKSILGATEQEILHNRPLESYGFVKNTIARLVLDKPNFYTVRLFGCFDSSEPSNRLFKKFLTQRQITIQDKFFDYVSAADFALVVEHYCCESTPRYKDINCVYSSKTLLSQIVNTFDEIHNLGGQTVTSITLSDKHYTGNGEKLKSLNLPLAGLVQGIKNYV